MEPRLLLICLATILLSSILLFIYFKNRISSVEEKVNVIFQLVQNHEQKNKINMYETSKANEPQYMQNENLIVVSDNDNESDNESESGSDSDSESDNEDVEVRSLADVGLNLDSDLVIGENMINEAQIKKIALNLEENLEEVGEVILTKEGDDEDDEDDEDNEDDEIQSEIKQTINYSKFKVEELKQMCQDKELENYKSLKKAQLVSLLENS
jgi:hypothetical protein